MSECPNVSFLFGVSHWSLESFGFGPSVRRSSVRRSSVRALTFEEGTNDCRWFAFTCGPLVCICLRALLTNFGLYSSCYLEASRTPALPLGEKLVPQGRLGRVCARDFWELNIYILNLAYRFRGMAVFCVVFARRFML